MRAALARFDTQLRDSKEWQRWEQNQAHKYAIEKAGRLYPVKQIVSLASGIPVSEFSGGVRPGQANKYCCRRTAAAWCGKRRADVIDLRRHES